MGILQSKEKREKHLFKKNIKNETRKEAAAKNKTDLNHGKADDLMGNLNNTANASQGLDPTQLINHQMEPSSGNEVMPVRMDQVPAVDAPEKREHCRHMAMNIAQDAEDKQNSAPVLQQAAPAGPTAGPCCGVKKTDLRFDVIQQLRDLPEILNQPQLNPVAQVLQKTKPTAPVQQQANRQVMCGHIQPGETRNFTPSQQRPAAKERTERTLETVKAAAPCDRGMRATAAPVGVPAQVLCKDTSTQVGSSLLSEEQQEMTTQLLTFKMQAAVHCTCIEVVREAPTENQPSKEAEAQVKAKTTKSQGQKSSCVCSNVNEAKADLTCQTSDIAKEHATKPAKPLKHSTQMLSLLKAKVNKKKNASLKHCSDQKSVTYISVECPYVCGSKSEKSRLKAAKNRLRQKLAKKKLMTPPGDGSKSFQQTTEETATTVPEDSKQPGCTALEENPVKEHNEPHLIPLPNKADDGNTSPCIQEVNVKAAAPHVPVEERRPIAAPHDVTTHEPTTAAADTNVKLRLECEHQVSLPQDIAARPKKKCARKLNQNKPKNNTGNVIMKEEITGKNGQVEKDKQEPAISPPVTPEHKVCDDGHWPQFTVNESCSRKARCKHNPGKGLQPNVQNWFDDNPNNMCEPPWVTTIKFATYLALREMEDEGDAHK